MDYALLLLRAFIAIFVIVNPFGILPIVLPLISDYTPEERKRVLRKGVITAFFVLLITALAGELIFALFQITLGALRIAGGIFLFILSLSMLYGRQPKAKINQAEREEFEEEEDVSITPLGIPIITGPGSIATMMGLMEQTHSLTQKAIVIGAIPLIVISTYIILRSGDRVATYMGKAGLRVLTRIMGLIVAVVAIQFVINGIRDVLPQILAK